MTPVLGFPDAGRWHAWLARNHRSAEGVWLRIGKKGSPEPSITYAQALDEALCFGWIDGQKKSHDAHAFLQKFTPRRPRSLWSKRNIVHCERLIDAGRMEAAGQAQIDAAKADGRWGQAYDPPSRATPPDDLVLALAGNRRAREFFETLDQANRYAITWRLQTAKRPETRARRLETFVEMLASGRKIHP
ncbi:MAG TPA: YdeI/OmpD-associated family protein [Myxococcaceae bacterium]|nr:YdeI/OmpD-associated family protein [Myxococcaceae bacterium]